ncbi:hypothetical protein IT407_00570 [Candidatus Uhrbacteria bacterium]|nr:hypothetical protein [Candidatus Uhrbacteria bacterium]
MTALNLNVGRSSFDRDMPDFDVEESENLAALGMHVTGGKDEEEEEEEGVEKEVDKTEVEKAEPDEKEKELEEVDELEELDRLEKEFRKEDAPTLEDVEE